MGGWSRRHLCRPALLGGVREMTHDAILTDLDECVGCRACCAACKVANDVPIGNFWSKGRDRSSGRFRCVVCRGRCAPDCEVPPFASLLLLRRRAHGNKGAGLTGGRASPLKSLAGAWFASFPLAPCNREPFPCGAFWRSSAVMLVRYNRVNFVAVRTVGS